MTYDPKLLLHGILENNSNEIYAVDLNYHYIAFNEKHKDVIKAISRLDIKQGMNVLDCFLLAEGRNRAKAEFDRTFIGESFIVHRVDVNNLLKSINQYYYYPLKENGKILGAVLFITDVSEKVTLEQEKEEYISALEKLIYKISHELRQPVSQIIGLAQVVNFDKNTPEEIKNILKLFKEPVSKLDGVTWGLNKFIQKSIKNKERKNNFFKTSPARRKRNSPQSKHFHHCRSHEPHF